MKQLVYETVVETEEDLVARITVAADAIAVMPVSSNSCRGRAVSDSQPLIERYSQINIRNVSKNKKMSLFKIILTLDSLTPCVVGIVQCGQLCSDYNISHAFYTREFPKKEMHTQSASLKVHVRYLLELVQDIPINRTEFRCYISIEALRYGTSQNITILQFIGEMQFTALRSQDFQIEFTALRTQDFRTRSLRLDAVTVRTHSTFNCRDFNIFGEKIRSCSRSGDVHLTQFHRWYTYSLKYGSSANDNSAYMYSANDKSALYRYKTASIDYSLICNRKRISEK
ncbi:hypothetical protein ANN_24087 [Periplaneta americana]|uniref:Uncharacterized protein n=1 Tax=Periplaneta americana TaxID=6978 RepID=A0ABQ8S2B9_PERAM|nr:hypothetical protein ANN_24087 [Periplaneta americana]